MYLIFFILLLLSAYEHVAFEAWTALSSYLWWFYLFFLLSYSSDFGVFHVSGVSVRVQTESLHSFSHLCSHIKHNSDGDHAEGPNSVSHLSSRSEDQLLQEFPSVLVPLASDNQVSELYYHQSGLEFQQEGVNTSLFYAHFEWPFKKCQGPI